MTNLATKPKILTGMRPSGRLHLGHYCGALRNWLKYAVPESEYASAFLIADYHALGDKKVAEVRDSVIQVAIDWLAAGLDPRCSDFVVQSYVPEHAELTMLLSTITPQAWLDANPTLKEERDKLDERAKAEESKAGKGAGAKKAPKNEGPTIGFMSYPISQVADILLPKATLVPAGKDQEPHLETTRRVAKRFNRLFDTELFPAAEIMLSETPRLVGTDGKGKMGKSEGNAIFLCDDPDTIAAKVRKMPSDSSRADAMSPGDPEKSVAFIYLEAFDPDRDELEALKRKYREGALQDSLVKARLTQVLVELVEPIRLRRLSIESDLGYVREVLAAGSACHRAIAETTMREVKEAMGIASY